MIYVFIFDKFHWNVAVEADTCIDMNGFHFTKIMNEPTMFECEINLIRKHTYRCNILTLQCDWKNKKPESTNGMSESSRIMKIIERWRRMFVCFWNGFISFSIFFWSVWRLVKIKVSYELEHTSIEQTTKICWLIKQ